MNILWLCNIIPPVIAKALNLEASNKEGWISGLCDMIVKNNEKNHISLSIASPVNARMITEGDGFLKEEIPAFNGSLTFYGFREDTGHPENYDPVLDGSMREIIRDCKPDLVHCFGTEYPHTLAMCRSFPQKDHILIHIQGLCSVYANAYFANLPEKIIRSATLRDRLKKDSLLKQQQKFVKRGEHEIEAIKLAGNIAGRTGWDHYYTQKWNPSANYFEMRETLRPDFYQDAWQKDKCIPHTIFLSQGDYPVKGLHYMLTAMPEILREFPDTKVYVAGNSIVGYRTLKQKLKISGYGKFLKNLIHQNGLEDKIIFLGKLTAAEMKERYLKSHLYVCCSSIENSPNSLGEAMMLGMPCVAADVGGIPDLFTEKINRDPKPIAITPNENDPGSGQDGHPRNLQMAAGILYKGFECPENEYGFTGTISGTEEEKMKKIAGNLSDSVIAMWKNDRKLSVSCKNARELANRNHNREQNYADLIRIYNQLT